MKKNKIQNIIIAIIAVLILSIVIGYSYSTDQTKQKGLQFGMELEQIQEEVKEIQNKFYSEKTKWEEGDISKEELLEFYEAHLDRFNKLISKYDEITPPELFRGSVELLKLSSMTQLESDAEYIKWIKTGDESSKIRSDTQFQESVEYEMLGLVEFYSAKTNIKNYDEREKFQSPKSGLVQKVIQVSNNMKDECDDKYKNQSGEFDSNEIEIEWFNCINEVESWKLEHLP